jgi:hypothetical protein
MAGVLSLFVVSANFPFYFFIFFLKEVECIVFFCFSQVHQTVEGSETSMCKWLVIHLCDCHDKS